MKLSPKSQASTSSVSHDPNVQKIVSLHNGDVPGILQWARSTIEPGITISEHQHSDAREIFHIVNGSLSAFINKDAFELEAGDVLVVDPGDKHAFENRSEAPCTIIYTLLKTKGFSDKSSSH